MYQSSPMVYHQHSLNYQPKLSSVTSSSTRILPLLQSSSSLNRSELSDSDLIKFVHPSTIETNFCLNQLSADEKIILQKAEEEERQYHREIQMTTLINSRYNLLKMILLLSYPILNNKKNDFDFNVYYNNFSCIK